MRSSRRHGKAVEIQARARTRGSEFKRAGGRPGARARASGACAGRRPCCALLRTAPESPRKRAVPRASMEGFAGVLSWLYCGFIAALLRVRCGFVEAKSRLCCGLVAALLRLCCSFVAACCSFAVAKSLSRIGGRCSEGSLLRLYCCLLRLCCGFIALSGAQRSLRANWRALL